MVIQTFNLHDTLRDLILANPKNQRDSSVERVLNLFGHFGIIVVESFSCDPVAPELT